MTGGYPGTRRVRRLHRVRRVRFAGTPLVFTFVKDVRDSRARSVFYRWVMGRRGQARVDRVAEMTIGGRVHYRRRAQRLRRRKRLLQRS